MDEEKTDKENNLKENLRVINQDLGKIVRLIIIVLPLTLNSVFYFMDIQYKIFPFLWNIPIIVMIYNEIVGTLREEAKYKIEAIYYSIFYIANLVILMLLNFREFFTPII